MTGFKDKTTTIDDEGNEVEKENKPKDIKLKVLVDGKQVASRTVKENSTNEKVSVSGKGTVTIEVWLGEELKKTVDMDLNTTQELVID